MFDPLSSTFSNSLLQIPMPPCSLVLLAPKRFLPHSAIGSTPPVVLFPGMDKVVPHEECGANHNFRRHHPSLLRYRPSLFHYQSIVGLLFPDSARNSVADEVVRIYLQQNLSQVPPCEDFGPYCSSASS